MELTQKVQSSIERCRASAADLRACAEMTDNAQAKNAFQESARQIEESIQQCRIALNQLVK